MNLKVFLIILLILIFFIHYLSFRENSISLNENLIKFIQEKTNEYDHDKLKSKHSEITDLKYKYKNKDIGLPKDKVLLTLFYEPFGEHSSLFYDNSGEALGPAITSEETVFSVIKENVKDSDTHVWNKIKYDVFKQGQQLYFDSRIMSLEEVKCDKRICYDKFGYILKEPSSISGNEFEIEKYKKTQAIRDDKLVDKLPKIILTFIRYDDSVKDELFEEKSEIVQEVIMVEYNGVYSLNNKYYPIAYNNILNFVQETMDKYLEIKYDDDSVDLIDTDSKIAYHNEKTGHTIDKSIIINKVVTKPYHYNYSLIKCPDCPMYIKVE